MSAGRTHAERRRTFGLAHLRAYVRSLDTLWRCRRGVAAVEFALAATPLLFIVFGFFAINLMFFTLTTMQVAAQNAALVRAYGQATTTNIAPAVGTAVSCSSNPISPSAEYFACSDPALPTWASFSVLSGKDCTNAAIPKVSVTVSVNASAAALADVFQFFTGQTLSTTVVSMAFKQGICP
jgi:Flp pilus assembly protein TadG